MGNVIVLSAVGSVTFNDVSKSLFDAPSNAINWFWAKTSVEPNTVNPVDEVILLEPVGLIVVTPATKGLLTVTDPSADRVITLPNETGTVITTGSTDIVAESMMANDAIGQNELKSVVSLIIYNSSGTPLKTIYGAGA